MKTKNTLPARDKEESVSLPDTVPQDYLEGWADGRVILADEIVTALEEVFPPTAQVSTHWEDCHTVHVPCAIAYTQRIIRDAAATIATE